MHKRRRHHVSLSFFKTKFEEKRLATGKKKYEERTGGGETSGPFADVKKYLLPLN